MPLSDHRQYGPVLTAVLARQPQDVLDIGMGLGLYGVLLRAHLGHDLTVVGVEPHRPYGVPGWDAYDAIVQDAWPLRLSAVPAPGDLPYDVALMIDVLEHYLDETAAAQAVDALVGVARALVVAYPKDALRDDLAIDYPDNPYEQHHWQPTLQWLATRPWMHLVEVHSLPDSYVCVLEVVT